MESSPSAIHSTSLVQNPLANELADLFEILSADRLLGKLQKSSGRGPKGFSASSLFRTFIASYFLNKDSIADTVRSLQDNPSLASVCGFEQKVPSRSTLSRFFARLANHTDEVHSLIDQLTGELKKRLVNFGENIAIDSSIVRAHSNGARKQPSDTDASWTAKVKSQNKNLLQWSFGYKLHAAVDAKYELPIAFYVTGASSNDMNHLLPLLDQARSRHKWFEPKFVSADKGYDSLSNYSRIVEDYEATPIIALRSPGKTRSHRAAVNFDPSHFPLCRGGQPMRESLDLFNGERIYRCNPGICPIKIKGVRGCGQEEVIRTSDNYPLFCDIPRWSEKWTELYDSRTSVERTFGRLKQHRRLERHCYRGLSKVTLHCLLSIMTLQAKAIAQMNIGGDLRDCIRKVA